MSSTSVSCSAPKSGGSCDGTTKTGDPWLPCPPRCLRQEAKWRCCLALFVGTRRRRVDVDAVRTVTRITTPRWRARRAAYLGAFCILRWLVPRTRRDERAGGRHLPRYYRLHFLWSPAGRDILRRFPLYPYFLLRAFPLATQRSVVLLTQPHVSHHLAGFDGLPVQRNTVDALQRCRPVL